MSYLNPIFPGMDPFIEDQLWREFHTLMTSQIRLTLNQHVAPLYYAPLRQYKYGNIDPHTPTASTPPPITSLTPDHPADVTPSTRRYKPMFYDIWEPSHVEIRSERGELVTLIEMLTPDDKAGGVDRPYLRRRQHFILNRVNFVEIDLLRGGQRTEGGMPDEGYTAFIVKVDANDDVHGFVYEIGLRDPLPTIPIPLHPQHADTPLNLAAIFKQVYVQARYAINVDHTRTLRPPLNEDDAAWVEATLANRPHTNQNGANHE